MSHRVLTCSSTATGTTSSHKYGDQMRSSRCRRWRCLWCQCNATARNLTASHGCDLSCPSILCFGENLASAATIRVKYADSANCALSASSMSRAASRWPLGPPLTVAGRPAAVNTYPPYARPDRTQPRPLVCCPTRYRGCGYRARRGAATAPRSSAAGALPRCPSLTPTCRVGASCRCTMS